MEESDLSLLSRREQFVIEMQVLLRKAGYTRLEFSDFEEYALFERHHAFVSISHMLTFTDSFGRIQTLRPDVTLSVMKQSAFRPENEIRAYYREDVFRYSQETHEYETHEQIGAEHIVKDHSPEDLETALLAQRMLEKLDVPTVLVLSHMGYLLQNEWYRRLPEDEQECLQALISSKNQSGLETLLKRCECPANEQRKLLTVANLSGSIEHVKQAIHEGGFEKEMEEAVGRLSLVAEKLGENKKHRVVVDFSLVNPLHYYNGLVFQGFAEGCGSAVISGGRYDLLARRFMPEHEHCGAIGFALDVGELDTLWK